MSKQPTGPSSDPRSRRKANSLTEIGFKSRQNETEQDWAALDRHLKLRGLRLSGGEPPRQFASGFGNLNYLLEMGGEPFVLRRPPTGPVPPGANDMGRENRILSGLWRKFPLAPKSIVFCDDTTVLGAPFFIMEYKAGLVIGGEMPPEVAERDAPGKQLGAMLVTILKDLHQIDPNTVGLGDLGRPEGFRERTAAGWVKRARLAWDNEPPPVCDELATWLGADQTLPEQTTSFLHNDFKLDNVVLDPETLEATAVLDWDLGTRGDPLVDLGVMLGYWTEAGDPDAMQQLRQMPTAGYGFPTREVVAADYAARTGRDLSGFKWYRVLTSFRVAVIFMQLHRRYREGGAGDPRFMEFGTLAEGLLDFSHEIAQGRVF
jgi:aminoglycoside phosphotransferase (APT) family kinase protein